MINILVIGAKLQGIEAIYLAKKAGYHVTVLDHNPDAPGGYLADEFFCIDIFNKEAAIPLFINSDIVLPAIENLDVLVKAVEYSRIAGVKILFDLNAYEISHSKRRSNELFIKNRLPVPAAYPDCRFPVILKPDAQSGSTGVIKAHCRSDVEQYLKDHENTQPVIQEYLDGPSYSLEVIGDGEHFFFPMITEVITDGKYDCKRIVAPADITESEKEQMYELGEKLAEALKIKGIFDIEVISHEGRLKLLEIDARLPSQTPISVYHSTGMNMVEMMTGLLLGDAGKVHILPAKRVCFYQQIHVGNGKIEVLGEHIIGSCRHLKIRKDFFGCTEAITDYEEGSLDWKAIIIVNGETRQKAREAFLLVIHRIKNEPGLNDYAFIES